MRERRLPILRCALRQYRRLQLCKCPMVIEPQVEATKEVIPGLQRGDRPMLLRHLDGYCLCQRHQSVLGKG